MAARMLVNGNASAIIAGRQLDATWAIRSDTL